MSLLAEVGIGSFLGEGFIDIGVPDQEGLYQVLCSWGPNLGFYLYIVPIVNLLLFSIHKILSVIKKKDAP
jgi:hypothetical protein